jgi:hypothetical protein
MGVNCSGIRIIISSRIVLAMREFVRNYCDLERQFMALPKCWTISDGRVAAG